MAATINTNVASLNAQRSLMGSQSNLSSSLQRLSSGLRINSAKDDAAGLAVELVPGLGDGGAHRVRADLEQAGPARQRPRCASAVVPILVA